MKALIALIPALLLAACASAPATTPAPVARAATYPAWLEMKPGYAETCEQAGKCTPMTDGEMQEFAIEVLKRGCGRAI